MQLFSTSSAVTTVHVEHPPPSDRDLGNWEPLNPSNWEEPGQQIGIPEEVRYGWTVDHRSRDVTKQICNPSPRLFALPAEFTAASDGHLHQNHIREAYLHKQLQGKEG